jgi:peptide-methionine (S)-S-oxide reductase
MTAKTPTLRYKLAEATIDAEDLNALADWLRTNPWLTQGPLVKQFERRWADWLGTRHAVFVNSGSSANMLMYYALLVSGRLKNRKVVVPAIAWATTVAPAIQLGFEPLMCDADPATFGLDMGALERLLAEHPRLARDRLTSPGAWLRDPIGGALDGFFKDPYLLWFVTEDAVRTGKLSPNVGEITRAIVRAAEREGVDTLPEQLESTIHFAVCSPVGREDGLQLELIDALIDAGASPDHPLDALICYNFAAAERLLERGARLTLPVALCLGRWDDVTRLAQAADREEKQVALALCALNGQARALSTLVEMGIDLDAFSSGFYSHATPLHHAVWSASLDSVKVLVEAGARLDTKDKANQGTPLGWADYAAEGGGDRARQYAEIAAYLREKGAP